MELNEALSAIREMDTVFESLKTVETVIETALGIQQETDELQASRDRAASELMALAGKKAQLEDLLNELGEKIKNAKTEWALESKAVKEELDAQKLALVTEIEEIKEAKIKAKSEHQAVMAEMNRETIEAQRVLAKVRRDLDKIKDML